MLSSGCRLNWVVQFSNLKMLYTEILRLPIVGIAGLSSFR
ncbi:hypothetical protein EVA_20818 [gut metagenome]|uniref:Uncharacterized protein n=1 Tax=gut metagenome TaxID=749906 RepID=J9BU63_9ZZZZ